jgi:hypothetical protein
MVDVPGFPWTILENYWLAVRMLHACLVLLGVAVGNIFSNSYAGLRCRASVQRRQGKTQKLPLYSTHLKSNTNNIGNLSLLLILLLFPLPPLHACQGSEGQAATAVPIGFYSGEAWVGHILLAWQAQALRRLF